MRKIAVIVDDGHGKNTLGKSSPYFLAETRVGDKNILAGGRFRENTFNMAVADQLVLLAKTSCFPTAQTAPEHEDIILQERVVRQRITFLKFQQMGFETITISIHANAHEIDGEVVFNSAHGIETFFKPIVTDQPIEWHKDSLRLANMVQKRAIKVRGQRDRRVEPANFKILKEFHGPTILFESGFMTNRKELELLASHAYQNEIASALLGAIIEYQGGVYKRGITKIHKII
jgi:N-acetylmuramoyl-L-alanine amidase